MIQNKTFIDMYCLEGEQLCHILTRLSTYFTLQVNDLLHENSRGLASLKG